MKTSKDGFHYDEASHQWLPDVPDPAPAPAAPAVPDAPAKPAPKE